MTKRTKILIPAGALVVLSALIAIRIISSRAAVDPRRGTAALVKVEKPQRMNVIYSLQFTGDVIPIQQANIFSKVSGNLEAVYADMGTRVNRNRLLALIDTTELHQQYQQAEATYTNARLTYERNKELLEQNLVAKQDFDNAETALKVSRAAFETAATQLSYARITAPFAGFITKRFLDPGANVTPNNSTLFTLMDLDAMKIVINILEKDIPNVAIGKNAVVTVDAYPGKEFYGNVTRYAQAVDPSTRTMAVEIDIPNKDLLLKPGMFSNVTLIIQQHTNAVTVPTAAILKDDQGTFVYAELSDTAHRIPVTPGIEQHARTEILSGLQGEEAIITTGQQFVKDNTAVQVTQ